MQFSYLGCYLGLFISTSLRRGSSAKEQTFQGVNAVQKATPMRMQILTVLGPSALAPNNFDAARKQNTAIKPAENGSTYRYKVVKIY
jgi:hypothetical protein